MIGTAIGITGTALGVISLGLSWYFSYRASKQLLAVAEVLQQHNEEVASATRVEFKRSMRAAGIRVPPESEEAIEVEFNGSGGAAKNYNWPRETWRVKQGDWSAYTDDWPTMIELVRYLTGEVQSGYPDDGDWESYQAAVRQPALFQMGMKLSPNQEEFWKGVHVLDEGS